VESGLCPPGCGGARIAEMRRCRNRSFRVIRLVSDTWLLSDAKLSQIARKDAPREFLPDQIDNATGHEKHDHDDGRSE